MQNNLITNQEIEAINEILGRSFDEQQKIYTETFPQSRFPGKYPIRSLIINIETRFNSVSATAINILKAKPKWISPSIKYKANDNQISSPFCCFDEQENKFSIEFGETFSAYVWCTVYFFLLVIEKKAQENPNAEKPEPKYIITNDMVDRAKKLLSWALNKKSSNLCMWPTDLPSPMPTSAICENECYYSLYANHIFTNTMTFFLYHEFFHALFMDPFFANFVSSKDQEKRADYCATKVCLNPSGTKITIEGLLISILMGFSGLLFLYGKKEDYLKISTHPTIPSRIASVIDEYERNSKIPFDSISNIKVAQIIMFAYACSHLGISYDPISLRGNDTNTLLQKFIIMLT